MYSKFIQNTYAFFTLQTAQFLGNWVKIHYKETSVAQRTQLLDQYCVDLVYVIELAQLHLQLWSMSRARHLQLYRVKSWIEIKQVLCIILKNLFY